MHSIVSRYATLYKNLISEREGFSFTNYSGQDKPDGKLKSPGMIVVNSNLVSDQKFSKILIGRSDNILHFDVFCPEAIPVPVNLWEKAKNEKAFKSESHFPTLFNNFQMGERNKFFNKFTLYMTKVRES